MRYVEIDHTVEYITHNYAMIFINMHETAVIQIQLSKGGSAAGQGEVELSRGDKILRFIGWLGGFYSRKAVRETVVL